MSVPEGFVKVGKVTDLAEKRGRCVRVGGEEVALWRVEGKIFAISNVCPHQHVSGLHMGVLRGLSVACPMHGWTYSLETGAVQEGEGEVKTYRVRVVGSDIYLEEPRPLWCCEMPTSTERVKAQALALGFSKVGIARATALEEEPRRLKAWLDRRYQAGMSWMERNLEKRSDPRAVLPGARSVVSVALNYYSSVPHSGNEGAGKISRYAWGDDYHGILGERLESLRVWIEKEFAGEKGTWYVDTGPVMDKVWAERAGIGWEGKHTNVITREYGSWVFLGELLTTLDLEPDEPAVDHCGTCTLCIDACPTAAIVQPYVVDANLCTSYLTIEHRGDIGAEIAGKFGRWIYGCDICQDVCPWNHKFATQTEEKGFEPREGSAAPLLTEWADMSQEEFRQRFKGSPVKRTRWSGLMRNIRAVLKGGIKGAA